MERINSEKEDLVQDITERSWWLWVIVLVRKWDNEDTSE